MNKLVALVSVWALAFTSGCMNVPGSKISLKNGTANLKKDDVASGAKATYYSSNGVVSSSLEIGSLESKNNPSVIAAVGQVRQIDWTGANILVASVAEGVIKGMVASQTGGVSLLPSLLGSGATATIPTTIPAVLPTPTPDSPTTLPAGAVVPPAQWRHYSNEYWLPIASLTATTQPPVGWKFSPAVAGPFCISNTTNCFIAIVPQ